MTVPGAPDRSRLLAGARVPASDAARFLFLHTAELEPTVLDSQIVDSIVALGGHGYRFDMAILLHGSPYLRQWSYNQRRKREIAQRIGGRVRIYPTPQKRKPLGDVLGTAELAFELARGGRRRTVIHARGDTSGFYASKVRRLGLDVRYVYDARGDIEAEFRHHAQELGYDEATRDAYLAGIERHRSTAVRDASHIWCVSSVLRDRLCARYGCDPAIMSVIPCVADERKFHPDDAEREATRRELGIENKFVVVFPGRIGRWHCWREMLAVVQALMNAYADVYFLVLTPDVEEANAMAMQALPAGRFCIRSARHAEVPRFLRASDIGLLLREPHPLNEVACPTKFGEYVSCGLPVVISAGIGDCSRLVTEHRAGLVLERPDPAAVVAALPALRDEPAAPRRRRLADLAALFSRERAAREMAEVYAALARGPRREASGVRASETKRC